LTEARTVSYGKTHSLIVADHGSDQEVSDPAGERSEGCIAKRKRRVTSIARRRFSKK